MTLLVICTEAGIRRTLNRAELERELCRSNITFRDVLTTMAASSPTLRDLSSSRRLEFRYISSDGALTPVAWNEQVNDYFNGGTIFLQSAPAGTVSRPRETVTTVTERRGPPAGPVTSARTSNRGAITIGVSVLAIIGFVIGAISLTSSVPSWSTGAPSSPIPASPQIGSAELERVVSDYYSLLPNNTEAAWALLTDRARELGGGRDKYDRFYRGLSSVRVSQGPTAIDSRTVNATIRFTKNGGQFSDEPYQFTIIQNGGRLLIDSFSKI